MFRLLSAILDKMGFWFGIIFKLLVPLVVMFRPIKAFSFSIVLIGTHYGNYAPSLNKFAIVVFFLVYIVLLAMLIWFPKVASAIEFVIIGYYIVFLATLYFGGNFSSYIAKISPFFWTYVFELPFVLLFLAGKIIFFFFILSNRKNIEELKREDHQLLYRSERQGYRPHHYGSNNSNYNPGYNQNYNQNNSNHRFRP